MFPMELHKPGLTNCRVSDYTCLRGEIWLTLLLVRRPSKPPFHLDQRRLPLLKSLSSFALELRRSPGPVRIEISPNNPATHMTLHRIRGRPDMSSCTCANVSDSFDFTCSLNLRLDSFFRIFDGNIERSLRTFCHCEICCNLLSMLESFSQY